MGDSTPILLLSMPQMADPNFARTVVLLCDYTEDGAFGLVVNRQMSEPAWQLIKTDPPVRVDPDLHLWIGGPVEPQRTWVLMSDPQGPDDEQREICPGVVLSVSHDLTLQLLQALGRSWLLAIMSIGFGTLLALPLAAGRVYGPAGIRHICVAVIEIVRGTPDLMVLFWIYFSYPALTGEALSSWSAATIALSIIAGVYLAEVIRGGLYSISRSQREAGVSTGLTEFQTFSYVILPQAVHNMIPAFIAQLISSFKTTSLAYIIGVIEFFRAIVLMNNALFAPYALYITLGCGYFVCCYAMSWVVRRLDPNYSIIE